MSHGEVAELLEQIRAEAELSQEQAAVKAGISSATVYRWETGDFGTDGPGIKVLGRYLGALEAPRSDCQAVLFGLAEVKA